MRDVILIRLTGIVSNMNNHKNSEGKIKKGQSRETGNIGNTRRRKQNKKLVT